MTGSYGILYRQTLKFPGHLKKNNNRHRFSALKLRYEMAKKEGEEFIGRLIPHTGRFDKGIPMRSSGLHVHDLA